MNSRYIGQMDREEFRSFLKEAFRDLLSDERIINTDKDLLNVKEAAAFLNLAVTTLYEKTSERTIPHYKNGKKITFRRAELIEWIEAKKVRTMDDLRKNALNHTTLRR
jgi:excisionase family DNA binding protein